jgi:soluble lytic murein transglycosylase
MKLFVLLTFIFAMTAVAAAESKVNFKGFISSAPLKLSNGDNIIADNLVNMMKLVEKGYVSPELLDKVIKETSKSKHFTPFIPWLKSIKEIDHIKVTNDLLVHCRNYVTKRATLPLEKVLERISGNYCREKALESIGRDIEKNKLLTDEASAFIQENLKFFLTKKNKKNFSFFIQSQVDHPEILKKLSQDVTNYSVRQGIVPAQEVLKDIVINEQITKLIQDKGFNPLQHQNVFYAEYGKLIELGYRALDPKAIDSKPSAAKAGEHYKFLKNYLELNQAHLPLGLCLSRLNDFAKAVFRAGFEDLSRDIFKFIIKKNIKDIQEDAYFFFLWTFLSKDNYTGTLKTAEEYKLVSRSDEIEDPRLKFWIAYALEMTDKKKEALAIYESVVKGNPLSYYAIQASKRVQVLNPDSEMVRFYPDSVLKPQIELSFDPKSVPEDHTSSLVRLRAWSKMDNQRMMRLELKRLNTHSMPELLKKTPAEKHLAVKSDLHLIHAKLLQESQNYLATFKYVYQVLDNKEVAFTRDLLDILYPRPYLDQLTRVMKNETLDPLVVLSLIRQESVFNPLARSPVGARGLMQLMPSTAKRFRRSVRDKHLIIPQINMELGVKYVKGLLKRYDGNLVYVLAAYNAGESRVERWKEMYFDSDQTILKNIESIPFLETRNYVKLIFRNLFFYKLLVEEPKKEQLADTGAHNKIFDVELGFKR